ncbi:hypothetical protein SLA2020_435530 [Shorea laevis]
MAVSTASFYISRSMSVLLKMTPLPEAGVVVAVADEGFRSSEIGGFTVRPPTMLLFASSLIFNSSTHLRSLSPCSRCG